MELSGLANRGDDFGWLVLVNIGEGLDGLGWPKAFP